MPIEEKKRALEFEFVEKDGGLCYDIVYENDHSRYPISVSCGGDSMSFSADFFNEVTEFLKDKGVIKKSRGIVVPSIEGQSIDGLKIPTIVREVEDTKEAVEQELTANTDPLASFDISLTTPQVVLAQDVEDTRPHQEALENKKEEKIDRPVIRTRVKGDDPLSAEKEAEAIRGSGDAGSKKSIKRVSQ